MSQQARIDDEQEHFHTLKIENKRMRTALHKLLRLNRYADGHEVSCAAKTTTELDCTCGYSHVTGALSDRAS